MAVSQTPTFGDLLKRYRTRARMSQEDLAERAELSARAISNLERGFNRSPRNATVRLLAEALGLSTPEQEAFEMAARGEATPAEPPPAPSHSLPLQLTPFIGREREVEEVGRMLLRADVRLLTLTGPGGTGKTRLALRTAEELIEEFPDGVHFVPLAAVTEPELVITKIGQAVSFQETAARSPIKGLEEHLQARQMLLVLDNLEQVVLAAPLIARLLVTCPRLKALATSRVRLRVSGEHIHPVAPLTLADPKHSASVEHVSECEAVQLFIARAQAVKPGFTLTEGNAGAVAEICRRLDGLPLAIELAAARVRLLSPQAMLQRLGNKLALLTGGAQDLPARQQTVRATLDWSYSLLDGTERTLLAELAVFAGGCELSAAEWVCKGEMDVFAGASSLVDSSLLRQEERPDGEVYLRMSETVREYALARLAESGESEAVHRRHAEYYLSLAEDARPEVTGPRQARWLDRLEAEHDNLRAALQWSLEQGDVEVVLRLSAALWRFWYAHTHLSEGRQWLEAALSAAGWPVADNGCSGAAHEHCPHALPFVQPLAAVLHGAGVLAYYQGRNDRAQMLLEKALAIRRAETDLAGVAAVLHDLGGVAQMKGDYLRATTLYEESLGLFRKVGDRAGIAQSLYRQGTVVYEQGEYSRTATLCEESLLLFREIGDKGSMAAASNTLGAVAQQQQDYGRAAALFEKGLALYREVHNELGIAWSIGNLAYLAWAQRDYQHAACFFEENLAYYHEIGNKQGIAGNLRILGNLAHAEDDEARAATLLMQSLTLFDELGDKIGIAGVLEGCAAIAAKKAENATGQTATSTRDGERLTARAARLWGAAEVLREELRAPMPSPDRQLYEGYVAAARRTVSEAAFVAAWEEGRALTLERAIEYALDALPRAASSWK